MLLYITHKLVKFRFKFNSLNIVEGFDVRALKMRGLNFIILSVNESDFRLFGICFFLIDWRDTVYVCR